MAEIEYRETSDPEALRQYFEIRHRIFSTEYGSSNYEHGDIYDKSAIFILAFDGETVVGGRRIIVPSEITDGKLFLEKRAIVCNEGQAPKPATLGNICPSIAALCSTHKYGEIGSLSLEKRVRGGGLGSPEANKMYVATVKAAADNGIDVLLSLSAPRNAFRMRRSFDRSAREGNPINFVIRGDIQVGYTKLSAPCLLTVTSPDLELDLVPCGMSCEELDGINSALAKEIRKQRSDRRLGKEGSGPQK